MDEKVNMNIVNVMNEKMNKKMIKKIYKYKLKCE